MKTNAFGKFTALLTQYQGKDNTSYFLRDDGFLH